MQNEAIKIEIRFEKWKLSKHLQRILFFCQNAKAELWVNFMKFIRELVQLHERENMKFCCFNYMPNLVLLQ